VQVTVIGCSGSFPGPNSPASCYLVEADGFSLLLDLGNGAIGALQRFHDLLDIDAICLTHLHPDHCLDLTVYWIARVYCPYGRAPRIPVYGPEGTADHMANAYEPSPNRSMGEAYEFRTFPQGVFELGPFRVSTAIMNHPVEAYALRIEHGGRVLTYSGDTAPSDALVELARRSDLFICEAAFADRKDNPSGMHLTGRQAGEHAARADAEVLVLTHLLPWFDPEPTLTDAKQSGFAGSIKLAEVGAVYNL
jgi:ribonuclease BN (tRNA processing enzyme)